MRTYGLIGYPLGHSFSKKFFTEKFEKECLSCIYENFELPNLDLLPEVLNANTELVGLNVTIPYKEKIIPFLNETDPSINEIGSVNTIRVSRKGDGSFHLKGFNTDVYGFGGSLKPLLKPHHQKALILGTGGASKAVAWTLKQLGIEYRF
ncbi:MAG: shikimate dehydrogenase, partial [Bacteroidota bacterium]|nr:shikimate dehydrogenase [Bacteroidota bacterium]